MRIITYGKKTPNLDLILPYLGDLSAVPEEVLEIAVKEKILLKKDGLITPGARFILFREDNLKLKKEGAKYGLIIKENLPRLMKLFEDSGLATQGFMWEEILHIIVFALCLDLGILTCLYRRGILEKLRSGFYLWGFEERIPTNNPFGIRLWVEKEERIGLAELWHHDIKPEKYAFQTADLKIFSHIFNRRGEKIGQAEEKKLMLFRYHGLIGQDPCLGYKITAPVIDQSKKDVFIDYLNLVSVKIVDEVIQPVFAMLENKSFIHKHGIVRLLMEYAADYMVEKRIVPPFAETVRKNWLFVNFQEIDNLV